MFQRSVTLLLHFLHSLHDFPILIGVSQGGGVIIKMVDGFVPRGRGHHQDGRWVCPKGEGSSSRW